MMYSEFYERTKYEPSMEEYAEIEEAYYNFDGNKDEFCQWFKKELRANRWEREYQLRRQVRELQSRLEEMQKIQHEMLDNMAREERALIEKSSRVQELEAELAKYAQPFIRYIVTE